MGYRLKQLPHANPSNQLRLLEPLLYPFTGDYR